MRADFNSLYHKAPGAGFCGQAALVRTPSQTEVLQAVAFVLGRLLFDAVDPAGKSSFTDSARAWFAERFGPGVNLKSSQIISDLVETFYFTPCFVGGGCSDPECREWVEVYGATDGNVYCHVSDCQLSEAEPEAKPDVGDDAPMQSVPFFDWVKAELDRAMADDGVQRVAGIMGAVMEEDLEHDCVMFGRAQLLQEILIMFGKGGAKESDEQGQEKEDPAQGQKARRDVRDTENV